MDEAFRVVVVKLDADETLHERTIIHSTHLIELVAMPRIDVFRVPGKVLQAI